MLSILLEIIFHLIIESHLYTLRIKGLQELRVYEPAHMGKVRSMFDKANSPRLKGQGLVEYALILALVAIVVIVILTSIGLIVSEDMYSQISGGFPP